MANTQEQRPPPDSPGVGAEYTDGEGAAAAEVEMTGTVGAAVGGGGSLACSHASCSGVNGSEGVSASAADDGERGGVSR